MTDKLQNEKNSEPQRINLAHGEDDTPDVVGHAGAKDEQGRVWLRGEDGAGKDGEGRLWL